MALTQDISRTRYAGNVPSLTLPVKAGQVFFKGSIVTVLNGLAYNATNSNQNHTAIGIAYIAVTSAQSTPGDGLVNGGVDLIIEPGTFGDFTPDAASNNPTFASRLTTGTIYIVDDDTWSTSSNGSTRCSNAILWDVADDGTSLVVQFQEVQS